MRGRMRSRVVPCHVLHDYFFLAGRLHCGAFQTLTEQILSLLFVSHLEAISCAFCFCQELTSTDFLLPYAFQRVDFRMLK